MRIYAQRARRVDDHFWERLAAIATIVRPVWTVEPHVEWSQEFIGTPVDGFDLRIGQQPPRDTALI